MKRCKKSEAHVGVCTILHRYRKLKNGEFSKTVDFEKVIWVTCTEDEWHDITAAGPLHEKLSREAEAEAREKYPREKGWYVYASESWAVDPPRPARRR